MAARTAEQIKTDNETRLRRAKDMGGMRHRIA